MIRILIDEGISRDIARDLRTAGHDVVHAIDLGLKSRDDPEIFLAAQARQASVCTLNRNDFVLLAHAWQIWGHGSHHGVIAPHHGPQPTNSKITAALTAILAQSSSLTDIIVLC